MTALTTLTVPRELANIEIGAGSHPEPTDPDCLCFMEAVALLSGEGRTRTPSNVDHTITRIGIGVSGCLDWSTLQGLKPLAPFARDTRNDGLARRRLAYALRWMITEFAPELLGRIGHWDRADELSEYFNLLPVGTPGDTSLFLPVTWAGPLGALQHARLGVRIRHETGKLNAVPADQQEYQDVDAMLSRIIAALTDFNDPGQFKDEELFIQHIAGELGEVFAVHLAYPFHKLETMITRFFTELIFTGRSYL